MNRLKELRTSKNIKQVEIAEATGISQQAYSYFEKGDSKPSLKTAKKIADFYKMSIEEIFFNQIDN